jgi:type IV secretion system protein VirB6/type IV secretion system protein TrbL
MASVILMMLALIGVNMLLLLISGWVLAYAGIFFLGMGGSRWTSDMAINYYKTVLGIGAQLMSMVLLVGIGKTFLDDYWKSMSAGINYSELGVMMIVSLILLVLTNKVPSMIAGVITGASVGNTGVGSFGAGAAIGAAGVAATVASAGGAALMAGAANMAGVGSAIKAASAAANAMSQGGGGSFGGSSFGGGGDSGGSGGSGGVGSALASAMGSSDSAGGAGAASSESASEGASFNPAGDGGGGGQAEASQGGTASSGGESDGTASSGGESGGAAPPAQAAEGDGSAQAAGKSWKNSAIANLARGTRDVLADKASDMKARAAERIAETPGGKVATAIRESTAASFGDDSLSAAPSAPSMDEVHAFSTKKTI